MSENNAWKSLYEELCSRYKELDLTVKQRTKNLEDLIGELKSEIETRKKMEKILIIRTKIASILFTENIGQMYEKTLTEILELTGSQVGYFGYL
ncbi:MAG: hypothetical protein AB1798_07275, partial [Spirochaetota bacterium]